MIESGVIIVASVVPCVVFCFVYVIFLLFSSSCVFNQIVIVSLVKRSLFVQSDAVLFVVGFNRCWMNVGGFCVIFMCVCVCVCFRFCW